MRSAMFPASSHTSFLLAAGVAGCKIKDIWLARQKAGALKEPPLSNSRDAHVSVMGCVIYTFMPDIKKSFFFILFLMIHQNIFK